ncbi:putative receptor-like protein kinase At3g47110 isoform X2 [Hevea brasiliensis]|uniref:putative receptor-like protein kinase At3g47110 isoform X2 n=1 Tax=Hevea brasiliensis TaxID=3981 RepID=UPI0025DD7DF0|nr:putative receptor-like protein kinase At3g47110 isoform X2 [Hevea brasiliensis]
MNWWSLCIAFLFFFKLATCLQNQTDRLALVSFKNEIRRDPFGVLSSWNDSLHFCDWYGVSCSRRHPDRVTALNLNSQGLVGSLSPYIGNLSFLRYVSLQNNSFHGQIPQEIGRLRRLQYLTLSNNSFDGNIPTNLSRCSNLYLLNLIDNKLQGHIPYELGFLPKLEALGLSRNNLSGIIPSSIGNMSSLRQISLRTNGLQGKIPWEISRLRDLRFLTIGENNLIGEVPAGLFNISSIHTLAVDFNQLQGSIPSDIGLTLPKLNSLLLADNRFSGPVPISLSNASALEQVALFSNGFSGLFPKHLGKLPHLRMIDFSDNQIHDDLSFIDSLTNCSSLIVLDLASNLFQATLPNSIANLSEGMIYIALSNNQIYDALPLGIENLLNLRFLLFDSNYLTGHVLIDFQKFKRLEMLDLSRNKFTGTISSSISNLSLLSYLYMGFNDFNGSIPPGLGTCHFLIQLDLSHNSLSGSIPRQVIGLPSLSISLNLAANALTGPIPSEVGLLKNLVQLDLSDNRLSGMIPNTIGNCLRLEQLHLEGNSFQGEIPQVLSALQGLKELDISKNNFSGRIPNSLADLDGMNYLNLSFNQLQGEVPNRGVFLNASAVALTGNNGLCGGITELDLPSCAFPKSKKNNLSIALKVTIPVVVITTFLALLTCFFIFWHTKRKARKKNISMPSFENQFLRISYAELYKATKGFSLDNIIGIGSYGTVYKGILEQLGMEVAVKVLNLQQRGASNSFLSECLALGSIRHRNLLKLLSVCSSMDFEGNDFKALIYEFMTNGSLEKWLHKEDGQETEPRNLRLIQRLNIAIDIASAIEYLHNGCPSTIIHGDLKPSNVLLDKEMVAHIGDFGLAEIVSTISDEAVQYPSTSLAIKGSIGYVAPGKKPTDDSFKDGLNLHTSVLKSVPDRVMECVDPSILYEDEKGRSVWEPCLISILRIGVACSMELPAERMKMRDVTSELQKIKAIYEQGRMQQDQGVFSLHVGTADS